MADVISIPGGVADLIARFITQFCLYAWVGASLIALVLVGIQRCTYGLLKSRSSIAFGLSFLPMIACLRFLCDENALLAGPIALLISLYVALVVSKHHNPTTRAIVACVVIPFVYYLTGGMAFVFAAILMLYTLMESRSLTSVSWSSIMVIVAISTPFAFHHQESLPLDELFYGPHYFRYPSIFPLWIWVAACIAVTVFAIHPVCFRFPQLKSKFFSDSIASAVVILLAVGAISLRYSERDEKMFGYDFMARTGQWNRIVTSANHQAPNNQIGVTALNLALSIKGIMANHMFDYIQNGTIGLLPEFTRDPLSPLVTSEAYYHLGMINTAQRFIFEAQEAIPDFQKSARCYKRLAQTNLINGSYEVARKYLESLQHTVFYRSWACETMALLGDEEAINKHPEYGPLRRSKMNEDYFFSDGELSQMLGKLFLSNRKNRMAFEYLEAVCLLNGDIDNFQRYYSLSESLNYQGIPDGYQQALLLLWSRDHQASEPIPSIFNANMVNGIKTFYSLMTGPSANPEKAKEKFAKTYWSYYFFSIPKSGN